MNTLMPGANAPVNGNPLTLSIQYNPIAGADIDISAFLLNSAGKVRGDGDMCFYGQPSVAKSAVQIMNSTPGQVVFSFNLGMIEAAVERIALTATIYENRAAFSACSRLSLDLSCGVKADIPTQGMSETALILGELYRRNGEWKFRCVAQGFAGGLEPLAKHFGVEIAAPDNSRNAPPAPPPKPTPTPSSQPTVNLNKITLDKSKSSISLEKKDGNYGEIKVNLNWNKGGKGGFLGFGRSNGMDLDLGCLFELKDGTRGVVQALGDCFGSFRDEPFIQLMGDDRTGANADGEWLRINGAHWREIKRILIFAFIYEGAPNWHATDGVVTLYVPGQPEVEVRMNEEGGALGMCGIAMLENVNDTVRVNREVRFFRGHEKLDRAYGWGMRWMEGSK
jgi:tellurite resistance protein TerA